MNKKVSKRLWFHIVFKNYGKRAFYIPLLVIGFSASLIYMRASGYFAAMAGAVFGAVFGIIIARLAAPAIGEWVGNIFYAPKEYLKTIPEILSPLKGRIAREEYNEAIMELNELLDEKPFSPEPYLIMVEVYANNLNNHLHAMELIEKYFGQEIVYIFEENIEMLLLYADICQEHNYLQKAQQILEQEIKRKGYPVPKRKRLEARLQAIKECI